MARVSECQQDVSYLDFKPIYTRDLAAFGFG